MSKLGTGTKAYYRNAESGEWVELGGVTKVEVMDAVSISSCDVDFAFAGETFKKAMVAATEKLKKFDRAKLAGPKLHPIVRRVAFAGRNDRCPCGSGRKYKRCCSLNN